MRSRDDEEKNAADLPERDPLADLVSRSVGARVDAVDVELLPAEAGVERKRLRFKTSAGATSAIFERRPRGDMREAQLLPFLARKTERVPRVYSRGLPPPHASLGPWLLYEDVLDAPFEDDIERIRSAKREIERVVASDVPALRALGIPGSGSVLVHGALTKDKARRTERGVVIFGWAAAYLGAGTDDERLL